MNAARLRAIHRYGAILSVVAIAVAVVAFIVRGSDSFIGLLFGFLGPLFGFYFVGAVLAEHPTYHVVGEELLRGVVWYFVSLVGWSFIITSSSALPATPGTAFGLPVLTALGLCLAMVATRRTTGLELTVRTKGGQLLVTILGGVVGGFAVLYLVLADGRSPWLLLSYAVASVVGLAVWKRHWWRQPA